ncbi:hypothetical protein [Kitasatospora sp. LaBMicrA B282]|uniref:hypothetical protein n=1 Tax=Kitasatospora sp. LaBMicrA B282 TaxID=3420949 RepID=UPI003D0D6012
MSPQTAALVLGITALLALIPMLVAVVRARRARDWTMTTTLVLAVGLAGSLPTVAAGFATGQQPVVTDVFGNPEVGLPAGAYRVDQAVNAVLLVGSIAFLVLRCVSGRARLNIAPLIAAGLCLELAVADGLNGHQLFASRQVVLILVLLAAAVATPGRPALLGAAMTGLLLVVLSGVQALLVGAGAFRDCRSDKCGVLGVLYTGVFSNENTFGLLVALSVPFIWLGLRGRSRGLLAGYAALVVLATGSRQSIAAAGVALLLVVLLRPRLPEEERRRPGEPAPRRLPPTVPRGPVEPPGPALEPSRSALGPSRPAGGPALLAVGAVIGAAVVGVVLPFLPLNPNALSQRAYFWQLARQQLPGSPLYGFGAKAWSDLYQIGEIPVALTYSTHNQWLDVLYAGGAIGLGIFLLLLGYLLLRGGLAGVAPAACVLAPVLVACCLERPWSFGVNDWLSFTLVAAALLPVAVRRPAPPSAPPPDGVLGSHALVGTAGRPVPAGSAPTPGSAPTVGSAVTALPAGGRTVRPGAGAAGPAARPAAPGSGPRPVLRPGRGPGR